MNSLLFNTAKTTILNIKTNKQLFSMSVATISIAFSVLGLFFLLFVNLNTFLSTWDKHVQLIVYLENGISTVNKNKLEGLSSYTLKFTEGSGRLQNIKEFSEVLKKQEGIESLEYGEKWISRFEKFMIFFRIFIITFGVILFSGMILIISNTTKLSIYSRKDEIDLMLLLGATHQFIKAPLLFEGLLQGIIGVLFALVTVKLVHIYIGFQFQGSLESIFRGIDLQYLTDPLLWSIAIAGVFIGMFGSLMSINQFLNTRNRE